MITYSKPSKYDFCRACESDADTIIGFNGFDTELPICKSCEELHIDLDILEEPNGIDVLLSKEVK